MNGHTFLPPRAVKAGGSPQRHEQTLPVLSAGLVTLQLMSLLQELLAQGSQRLTSVGGFGLRASNIFWEPLPGGPSLRLDEQLPTLWPRPPSTASFMATRRAVPMGQALGSSMRCCLKCSSNVALRAKSAPGCYLPELASPCFRNSPAGQGSVSPVPGITPLNSLDLQRQGWLCSLPAGCNGSVWQLRSAWPGGTLAVWSMCGGINRRMRCGCGLTSITLVPK